MQPITAGSKLQRKVLKALAKGAVLDARPARVPHHKGDFLLWQDGDSIVVPGKTALAALQLSEAIARALRGVIGSSRWKNETPLRKKQGLGGRGRKKTVDNS